MKFIFFFVLFTVQVVLSQYTSAPDHLNFEAIQNKVDLLIFETNIYIAQNSKCLSKLYADLEKGKRTPIYANYDCGNRSPLEAVSETDEELLHLINMQFPSYYNSINSTVELVQQLNQLIEQQQLNTSRLNELLLQYEASAQEFKLQTEKLTKENQKKTLEVLPISLKKYILNERLFIQSNQFYLRPTLKGNFPSESLKDNISTTDLLLIEIKKASENDKILQQITGQIIAYQQTKKDFLHQLAYDKLLNCDFRNEFYFQLHNYFNNGIIPALKIYYQISYGLSAIYQPFNNLKHQEVAPPKFAQQALITDQIKHQNNNLNTEQYQVLVDHINLINQSIMANNTNASVLFQLGQELPSKRTIPSYKLSMKLQKNVSFNALRQSAIKLQKTKSAAFQVIANQSNALAAMLNDCNKAYNLIKTEFSLNNVGPDNYEQLNTWLIFYKDQLNNISKQIQALNKNLSYYFSKPLGSSAEASCSDSLLSYCNALKETIKYIENNTNSATEVLLIDQPKLAQYQATLLHQSNTKFSKIDEKAYVDVYSLQQIYQELVQQGKQLADKYSYLQENALVPFKKGCCQGYLPMLNDYNYALMYFNEFSRMSAQKNKLPIYGNLLIFETIILP